MLRKNSIPYVSSKLHFGDFLIKIDEYLLDFLLLRVKIDDFDIDTFLLTLEQARETQCANIYLVM